MDLHQLRCFLAVAEELHFGRAAQRLGMLPSALGRHIRLLEEDLGTRLLARTTRNVALTEDGAALRDEARGLLDQADTLAARFRAHSRSQASSLRVGAIDSAAAGLLPLLLHDFREAHPEIAVQLLEDKSIRLLPRLLSGRLDLAFVRPPEHPDAALDFFFLFYESAVVAVPKSHRLARREKLSIQDLAEEPLIVPERRSRPHSHDLTIKLFTEAGLQAQIAQVAEEKQTIVNLVAAELGVAIVPRWTARMATKGVRYIPLKASGALAMNKLPLAAAWPRGSRDPLRDDMLAVLQRNLAAYAEQA
ncbi:LysR family transcriptional regulator [Dongia soli]|uniref:LysR family transcriptional regulator n=1 Tax=Dongia soli TaxID=600628 RepID=A0ABU5EEG6_9PROT|nr:LysR family transcriptional regulator [Dongia soli]MDY0884731.1 LysR family transcriptional regulator [Dongia soli]